MSASVQDQPLVTSDAGEQGWVDNKGRLRVDLSDGRQVVRTHWRRRQEPKGGDNDKHHTRNIALELDSARLGLLASELLREIQDDERSLADYFQGLANAVKALGMKVEEAGSAESDSSAPLEGMSNFQHPLLLQACIRFQADFVTEMLPADGPVKVRDDSTNTQPAAQQPQPTPGDNNPQPAPVAAPITSFDLSAALQRDMNHYLTTTATEYYPDTTRMAFKVGLFGAQVKKVYNCPLRKRPVSEAVDIADIIVDYTATDFRNAERITHRIKMRPSRLRRLVAQNFYRDVDLGSGRQEQSVVEQATSQETGVRPSHQRADQEVHVIYECCTERDIESAGDWDPYKITIDKESQQILSIYRNWDAADESGEPKMEFVKYSYVDALGFYGIGLYHILGNTIRALTAAFREFLDSGMFASFPGFLYAEEAGKQIRSQFRIPPGGGAAIKTGGRPIGDVVRDLPYRSPDAGFMQFIQHVEENGRTLAGEASVPLNEGTQNMPVGTMLAQIEQTLRPIKGVFKGLHRSQAEEYQLMRERFRENPEAFWKFDKRPNRRQWEIEEFLQALENTDLVPMADPNTSSQVQRIAVAWALLELAKTAPYLFHERDVALRFMRMVGIPDPEAVMASMEEIQQAKAAMAQQAGAQRGPAQDPALTAAKTQQAQAAAGLTQAKTEQTQAETQAAGADLQEKALDRQAKTADTIMESQERAADRQSHERIAELRQQEMGLKTGADLVKTGVEQHHEALQGAATRQHELVAGFQTAQPANEGVSP